MSNSNDENKSITSIKDLQAMTTTQLKSQLKALGLKLTGHKSDLVQRMAEALGLAMPLPGQAASADPQETSREGEEKTSHGVEGVKKDPIGKSLDPGAKQNLRWTDDAVNTGMEGKMQDDGQGTPEQDPFRDAEEDNEAPDKRTHKKDIDYARMLAEEGEGWEQEEFQRYSSLPEGFHEIPAVVNHNERRVLVDHLDRKLLSFAVGKDHPRQAKLYMVATKQAMRPWDGPHGRTAELRVVVLLSDVYGWEDRRTRRLADQVADISHAVVLVPDLFRGSPWSSEDPMEGYEAWRASHPPERVSGDIRACASFARSTFRPKCLGLMGICYGGGRALEEAAAGVVKPDNLVLFYPTRYNLSSVAPGLSCPVAAFFAGEDDLDGARQEDARALHEALAQNEKVGDFMIRIFPGQRHGFAHHPREEDQQDAEDALLLATSWMDVYLQKRLMPWGGLVKDSENSLWT
ncbi:unnamed protein product [Discosporangium mesarthrocarpum]